MVVEDEEKLAACCAISCAEGSRWRSAPRGPGGRLVGGRMEPTVLPSDSAGHSGLEVAKRCARRPRLDIIVTPRRRIDRLLGLELAPMTNLKLSATRSRRARESGAAQGQRGEGSEPDLRLMTHATGRRSPAGLG